jgi:hypothetical protein
MVIILSVVLISCVCRNFLMYLILKFLVPGTLFGDSRCRRGLKTLFGEFVGIVYQLAGVFKIKGLIVTQLAPCVIRRKKTIFISFLDAQTVVIFGACGKVIPPYPML